MKKVFFAVVTIVLCFLFTETFAQRKNVGGEFAVGARLGGAAGLTVKKYSGSGKSAFEFLVANSFEKDLEGFTLTAVWEKLAPLNSNGQLSAEFGFGATATWGDEFWFGPSGIIGFDWRLKKVPVSMSVDWLPTWILVNDSKFSAVNVAYSVRWIINSKKTK
jgi:hypothetical protein